MGFKEKMVKQVRKPQGRFGRRMAKMMNYGPHAKMAKWAFHHIPVELDSIILDIGCGGGKNLQRFAKRALSGKIHGIDYSEVSVKVSKKTNIKNISSGLVEICKGSVSSLPYEDNYFDLITGFECHFFWPDIVEDLKEVKRVLKPGSALFLIAETYLSDNEEHVNQVKQWAEIGNFPVYSPKDLKNFFQEAGYDEIEIILENDENWLLIKAKKG
jgi:ubiquinone/menaquinone biosynthesis C-methylase UbiE